MPSLGTPGIKYKADYKVGSQKLFGPAHWLDRKLFRREHWADVPPKPGTKFAAFADLSKIYGKPSP